MKSLIRFCLLGIFTISILNTANCQIIAIDVDAIASTAYKPSDSIYIYNQYETVNPGIFNAKSRLRNKADFSWSRYDTTSKTFTAPLQINLAADSSIFQTQTAGGYKVTITNSGTADTSIIFWYFQHKISFDILKDDKGYVLDYSCKYVDLEADAYLDTFKYYDNVSLKKYSLLPVPDYTWTADPTPESALPKPSGTPNVRTYDPPFENTEYTLQYTDNFHYDLSKSVLFKAIRVKADFSFSVDSVLSTANGKYSAPCYYTLTNSSINSNRYTWFLYNDTVYTNSKDDLKDTLYISKKYRLKLFSENTNSTCSDSVVRELTIENPKIDLPNILIPDGIKTFKPTKDLNLSIKNFKFVIFNRYGKVMYEEPGFNILTIKGWNGYYKGKPASEGVYFYILNVDSFNKTNESLQDIYKGFFYIFNN